ncbi:uncharacterized protein KY384_003835 [Bacidia gigantensis]|uniref:uncharacterized protein n=1 Tax=Bacidia gigantensis TaxID=2732470 RepID=UPI001D0438CA|nr:uncharacterized protein KY384_003835 [Bacidia gigantensis]KAG8532194.1 hypothetical protein KY384_003835 [Bacidia gigantensis]
MAANSSVQARSTSRDMHAPFLPYSRLVNSKRSPCLKVCDGMIECSSANTKNYLLQPHNEPLSLNGVFIDDSKPRKPEKEEDIKVCFDDIKMIQQRLARRGVKSLKDSDIFYALSSSYAKGDKDKAYELLMLFEDSEEGIIHPYQLEVKLLGAVNRNGVTCWLDALLFAMFARLENFEAVLYKTFKEDKPRQKLAILLRLWINSLRAGKLITVEITKQIQIQLAACGWDDAAELRQHDASEAFTFITETLELPLLSLQMDLFHVGKEDKEDDHKIVKERLLELAIPEQPPDGQEIKLEDCLEMYFNNRIEVRRYLEEIGRRNTLSSVRSRDSIDSTKGHASLIEVEEVGTSQPASPMPQSAPILSPVRPSIKRQRAPSIIQEHYIDEKRGLLNSENEARSPRLRREVMMPAWQFFRLIPWYTECPPATDAQVAAHFSTDRPILGICLKRYGMYPNGVSFKKRTHVDIPLEIGLPHFITADDACNGPAFGNFKLSLQSAVCHQGISTESGHYIALVRTPDPFFRGQDQWMRFDDLAKKRVLDVRIEDWLKGEATPYLLFYQVMPIEEPPSPTSGEVNQDIAPPSYAESNASKVSKPNTSDNSTAFSTSEESAAQRSSLDTSISDAERGRSGLASQGEKVDFAPDPSFESGDHGASPPQVNTDPNALSDALANLRTSRRGSRNTKTSSKSRPSSQSGENRLSNSFHRLTNRMSRDKLSNMPAQGERTRPSTFTPGTTSISGPISTPDKAGDKTKLKKEAKERAKGVAKENHLITKSKKPDRECALM